MAINPHIPAYVGVYNKLYSDIINGVYLENDFLPGEETLAKKYNVSRNTLRQALAILSEDGLVIKAQGKGTIVKKQRDQTLNNKIVNPMIHYCSEKITNTTFAYNFSPPTDIAKKKLGLNDCCVILASNNVYYAEKIITGYSFVQIPISVFESLNIKTTKKEHVEELINEKIFSVAKKSTIDVKLIKANEIEIQFLPVNLGSSLLLCESILYNTIPEPIARCKYYIRPEFYNLQFTISEY